MAKECEQEVRDDADCVAEGEHANFRGAVSEMADWKGGHGTHQVVERVEEHGSGYRAGANTLTFAEVLTCEQDEKRSREVAEAEKQHAD